ncbi:MAG: ABC transporter substrate-binding protein, partial [Pseudomonadota bacterium]
MTKSKNPTQNGIVRDSDGGDAQQGAIGQVTSLLKRGASRRQIIKYLTTSGLALAAAGPLLAKAQSALAATPAKGGHARVGVRAASTTDSLDPATFTNGFMRTVGYGICNNLAEIAGDGSLVPELVESWEAKPGASEWIFKIRPGVEFHNGKTLDADDVIASIEHHRGEDSKSGMKAPLGAITALRKDDPDTLVLQLAQGNADFPYVFTDYRLMIMPSKDGALDWSSGVGTGGYKLQEHEPGVAARLERNPNYWREDRAFFDSAEVISMPDIASRQTALLTGEIDVIDQVDLKSLHLLKEQSGVEIVDTVGALHYTYPMNTQQPPFDNNDLRLALKYGIDREALLSTVLRGYGTLGNDHPIAPSHQFYAGDLEQRTYDPDKARHHLKQAGHDSLDLSLSVSDVLYPGA